MQTGVQLYTLRKDLQSYENFPRVLQRVKDMGAACVQISAVGPYDSGELGSLCRELGLAVCATHSNFTRIKTDLDALAQEHLELGCPQIGIGMLPREYDRKNPDSARAFIEFLNKTGEHLQQYGLTIAYHNHWFEFKPMPDGKPMLDWLIEQTQPYVEFILDSYWVKVGGYEPQAYIDKLAGRMSVLHLKDYQKRFGFFPAIKALGEGTLDFVSILKHAKDAGVSAAVVELDYAKDPYASLTRSLRHIETCLAAQR